MVFVFWFLLALLVGYLGSGRNIGFWGSFILSLLLSPLIGALFVLFSDKKSTNCKYCGTHIPSGSKYCPGCGKDDWGLTKEQK